MMGDIADNLWDLLSYNASEPMIFSSGLFLWLFVAFYAVYTALRNHCTPRLLFVVCFSYYFYYKSSGFYFFLLAVVTVADFILAQAIGGIKWRPAKKLFVAASLAVNLGLLCWFKYTNFFGEIWASATGLHFEAFDIFLPVGISFFTFQSLSYTIDVYRGRIKPLNSLLDYAFYVSFFPQLVAGPIVRAKDFIPQIRRPLTVTHAMVGQGVWLIATGLFKKVVISDYISLNFVDRVFAEPSLYTGAENLAAVYGYTMQIYCDFSGYSDMAIGIALLMGFHFNANFNSPYKSASITEFWRRWHISLSSWLKDYLYISLGGNRKGKLRQYLNLFITMFLGGLWHGASWNFVLWGSLHGIALVAHKVWMTFTGSRVGERGNPIRRLVNVAVTFHIVALGWIFFRNSSLDNSITMIGQIFRAFHGEVLEQFITGYSGVVALIALAVVLHFVPSRLKNTIKTQFEKMPLWTYAVVLIAVIYITIQMKSTEIQPFIYFQF